MLHRKLATPMLFNQGDPTTGEPPATQEPPQPDTPQGQQNEDDNGGQSDAIQLTPAQLKQRLDRAQSSALNALLEGLGVDSVDTLKSTLDSERQRKEAEMTELEKMQLRIDALEKQKAESESKVKEIETQRLNDRRDNGLLQLLDKAYDKQSALILIKAKHADRMTNLISEDGTFDDKEAKKLIEDFQKENAVLFQSGAPGSPSNNNGRAPDTSKEAREIARKASIKRLRRNV